MHELPTDLSNSLKSWRGSVHRNKPEASRKNAPNTTNVVIENGRRNNTGYDGDDDDRDIEKMMHEINFQSQDNHNQQRSNNRQQYSDGAQHSPQNSNQQNGQAQPKSGATVESQVDKISIFTGPKVDDPDPAADRLDNNKEPLTPQNFYELMGMLPPTQYMHEYTYPPRKNLGTPHGLYKRVHEEFEYVQMKYRIFDVLTYIFLAFQVLLSAVFVIIGSLRVNSHVAIAVLGAISAVVSGSLALMKGQGLPNRMRQMRDALRNVIFEMEELYADVCAGKRVLFGEVVKVREDYLRILETARMSHPDAFNSSTKGLGPQKGLSGHVLKNMTR